MTATSPTSSRPLPQRLLEALAAASSWLTPAQLSDLVYRPRRGGEWSQARRDEAVEWALAKLVGQRLVHGRLVRPPKRNRPSLAAYELTPDGRLAAGRLTTPRS